MAKIEARGWWLEPAVLKPERKYRGHWALPEKDRTRITLSFFTKGKQRRKVLLDENGEVSVDGKRVPRNGK